MANLSNIIPNPLLSNNTINKNYNDTKYATSDFNGEENTKYLRYHQENINNIIPSYFYIPSIGELGLAMENIQQVNDSINISYGTNINYNSNIVSSTFRTKHNITYNNYEIIDNIDNVWYFNTTEAKIAYNNISNNYIVLPFYKYVIQNYNNEEEEKEEISNIVINNYNIITASDYYIENNKPTLKYNLNDFKENPFSAQYLYYIMCPEVIDYMTYNNINISDISTTYNIQNNPGIDNDEFNEIINNLYQNHISGIESNNEMFYAYISNNGVCNYKYKNLLFNIPVYNNHIVLMPLIGAFDHNYNLDGLVEDPCFEIYCAVPKDASNVYIKIGNRIIEGEQRLNDNNMSLYCFVFKLNTNNSNNIIEFNCNISSTTYSRQYFYTIYSFMIYSYYICNYNNTNGLNTYLNTYIYPYKLYSLKYSYNWNIISKNNIIENNDTNLNKITGLSFNENMSKYILNNGQNFGNNINISKIIDDINYFAYFDKYSPVNERGLRIDRLIETDTVNIKATDEVNEYGYYYRYTQFKWWEEINNTIKLHNNIKFDKYKYSTTEFPQLDITYYGYLMKYYNSNDNTYDFTYNNSNFYHLFSFETYYTHDNLSNYYTYNMHHNDITYKYFVPILRTYREVDSNGLYNDLILTKLQFNENINHTLILNNNENEPINVYYDSTYTNKFRFNIPIVGAKQTLCFPNYFSNFNNVFNQRFKDNLISFINSIYYQYLFSDYLFIINNTESELDIFIKDPSLSICPFGEGYMTFKSHEIKLYYPNNFINIDNIDNNFNDNILYTINLYDYDHTFNIYNFGELNRTLEQILSDNNYSINKFIEQPGYKKINYLIDKCYKHNFNIDEFNNDNDDISFTDLLTEYNSEDLSTIRSSNTESISINISNYLLNKAGHLIIIQ